MRPCAHTHGPAPTSILHHTPLQDDSREDSQGNDDSHGETSTGGLPHERRPGSARLAAKRAARGEHGDPHGMELVEDDEGKEEEDGVVGMDVEDELAEMADALLLLHEGGN